jgi:hypothetical protein
MTPPFRSFPAGVILLLAGWLLPAGAGAQALLVDLNFDAGDFTQTGTAATTFTLAQGNVTFESGVGTGLAAVFDGTASLQASDTPVSAGLTIAFWMKTTTDNGIVGTQWYEGAGVVDGELGGDTTDFGLSQMGTQIAFGIGSSDATIFSTSNVNTGTWTHVAATWDTSGSMNLYVNGLLEASYSIASHDLRDPGNHFFVGMDLSGATYTGSLDEIRLYDSVLSSGQIAGLATLAAVPEPPPSALLGLGVVGLAFLRRLRARGTAVDGRNR